MDYNSQICSESVVVQTKRISHPSVTSCVYISLVVICESVNEIHRIIGKLNLDPKSLHVHCLQYRIQRKFHTASDGCCEGLGGPKLLLNTSRTLLPLLGIPFMVTFPFMVILPFYSHVLLWSYFFYGHKLSPFMVILPFYGHILLWSYFFYGHISFPFMVISPFMVIPGTLQLQIFTLQEDKAPASLLRR